MNTILRSLFCNMLQEIAVSIPLHELASVKFVEQRGADILEVKRASGGQSTTLQLLTNEVFSLNISSIL